MDTSLTAALNSLLDNEFCLESATDGKQMFEILQKIEGVTA